MLLKPYTVLNDEQRDPFTMRYIGVVSDNNDPEKRKRLRIQIDPWSYMEDEDLPWVKQEGNGTIGCSPNESEHHIPEVGSEVTVYFKNNDPNDPVYAGVETTEANRCSLFDEDYPNTYGKKDSAGNYEITNKSTGITVRQYASGTKVQSDPDGAYVIETAQGDYIKIDGDGSITLKGPNIKIYAENELELRASKITMNASGSFDINGSAVSIKGTSGVNLDSQSINLNAKSDIELVGARVMATNFAAANGVSGSLFDVSLGLPFLFNNGILTSNK